MQILSTPFFFLMDGSTVVQVASPGKCKIADQQILCLELARPEPCEMLCHGQRLWRSRGGVWIHIDIDLSNHMKSIQGETSVRQFFFDRPNYVHETQMARVEHGTNLIVMSTHSTRIYQASTPCTVVLPFRWSMGPSMSIHVHPIGAISFHHEEEQGTSGCLESQSLHCAHVHPTYSHICSICIIYIDR